MKSGNDLLTMVPTKYLLAVFALFLVSVFYQGSVYPEDSFLSSGSGSNNNYSDRALDIVFDGNVYDSRKKEQRIPIEPGEFWLTESDNAVLPFDVYFTPPDESYGKLETLPSCNNDKHNATKGAKPTKIIFAHVVRTEAFRVHDFLASYASSCHAGFASAGKFLHWVVLATRTESTHQSPEIYELIHIFFLLQPFARVFPGNR